MYAKELVGKTCIREKPVIIERYVSTGSYPLLYGGGEKKVEDPDYEYCKNPVRIVAATDHNIVCEKKGYDGKPFVVNLDERYCDDGWTDYDVLVSGGAGPSNEAQKAGDNEQGA